MLSAEVNVEGFQHIVYSAFTSAFSTQHLALPIYTRRDALGLIAATGACGLGAGRWSALVAEGAVRQGAQPLDALVATAVERNDAAVQSLLQSQITDSASPWRGSVPDQVGLHSAGSASGVGEVLAASFVHPRSRFHRDAGAPRTYPPRRGIPRARAEPSGQHRSAHHELQLAARHRLRRSQRRDRGGHRPPARRPGDRGRAPVLPAESRRGDGRRGRPHAEPPLGDLRRARTDR